ncbi:unnamed protein product, partial [Allacma fusca]
MLSPQTKGLFQKAIALSGTAGSSSWSFSPAEKAHFKSKQIAEFFHCPTEYPALLTTCLQRVPASEILSSVKYDVEFMPALFPHREGYMFAPTLES